jgi:hypothetical protein
MGDVMTLAESISARRVGLLFLQGIFSISLPTSYPSSRKDLQRLFEGYLDTLQSSVSQTSTSFLSPGPQILKCSNPHTRSLLQASKTLSLMISFLALTTEIIVEILPPLDCEGLRGLTQQNRFLRSLPSENPTPEAMLNREVNDGENFPPP